MKCSDCEPNWRDYEENLAEIKQLRQQLAEVTRISDGAVARVETEAVLLQQLLTEAADTESKAKLALKWLADTEKQLTTARQRIKDLEAENNRLRLEARTYRSGDYLVTWQEGKDE